MLKAVIFLIFAGLILINYGNADGITKEECIRKGGSYCPGKKYRECYFTLKEEVSTYEEAVNLCAKKGAVIPHISLSDYANFLNCTKFPWKFPFVMFLQPSLPTSDKCITATYMDISEFTALSRCSLQTKAKVVCEIPF
ncbi:UNVERIFIED_CONTAM: hypothetical protein RMT77_008638 [Armadillidium vulgare]